MALESFKAQISLLLEEMVNQPEDEHEIQEQLREKLREMRAMGLTLPDDLVKLEKRLDDDLDVEEEDS
jgi:predicted unusual protein kinase regulating ubiquinone biosynthesis (AarF/ABC1/UbiB family)